MSNLAVWSEVLNVNDIQCQNNREIKALKEENKVLLSEVRDLKKLLLTSIHMPIGVHQTH